MHYYKFNIADWQSATRHLTLEEEGVYFRLINFYYDTEKPIPLETESVIRRLMLGSHVDIVRSILDEFFIETDRGYEKEKCNELIKEYKKTANKNRKNGALGGRPKKDKGLKETQSEPSGFPVDTQEEPKHNPNQELRTTNHKPITNNQKHKSKKFNPSVDMWNDWGFPSKPSTEIFNAWLTMRRDKKYTISELSFKGIGTGLREAVQAGFTVDQCLTKAEGNSWKGFSASWMINSQSSARPSYQSAQPSQQGFLDDDFIDGEVING